MEAIVYLVAALQVAAIIYALVQLTGLARSSSRQADALEEVVRRLGENNKG